jgi:hypothetical protein
MRHWIIGTGKSLLNTPLDLLKGEITWGMNRIHKYYDRTSWRPSHYVFVDFNQQNPKDYWKDCIRAHWNTRKWLWNGFRGGDPLFPDLGSGIGDVPNTTWIPRCKKHHYYMASNWKRAEKWHLPDICTAFSVIGAAMQLAVLHGADEIYLVGCDLYVPDYRQNFFDEDYTGDFRARDVLDNENMIQAHTVARRSSPAPIFNATIGGALEVHPRVNIFEVLGVKDHA